MAAKFRGVHPKVVIEKEYYRALRRGYLTPYLEGLFAIVQTLGEDATTEQWIAAIADYTDRWNRENAINPDVIFAGAAIAASTGAGSAVERAVLAWAERTIRTTNADFARDIIRVAKVDVRPALQFAPLRNTLQEKVFENIRLIKTIPDRFHNSLASKMIAGELKAPLDREARERMFRQTGHSAGYNLRRITRDQTNKLTGQINQANQESLGIETYRWQTSADDRVRPTHRVKDDMIFEWKNPPPDTGHPGQDIQCRCQAIPEISIEELKRRFG